jgi:glycerophosphoryl diester phosphodiesterase
VRRALELGARGIEIDVWLADGELVVIHDAKLERTTNGSGYVSRKSLAYLRSLDAGHGERIPTLKEVFETVARRALINIELKGRRTAGPVTDLIREFVSRHGWSYENFLVSSFNRSELRAMKDPLVRIGLLLTRPSRLYALSARRVKACAVHPAFRYVNAKFVADAHRRGFLVYPYTVNAATDIERLRRMGVDGVFTDYPERAITREL